MATTIITEIRDNRHESKLIQHLGIIGGMCDECRLAALIDRQIEQKRRKVSVGQAVQPWMQSTNGE